MSAGDFKPSVRAKGLAYRRGGYEAHHRNVPNEVPVSFSFLGTTYAVLMATPDDWQDFAVGFCISEGIVSSVREIVSVEVVPFDDGVDLQIKLAGDAHDALKKRRRAMAGPVGCGLCGIESIEEALRAVPSIETETTFDPVDIVRAAEQLALKQPLNRETRAVHGAGFYVPGKGLHCVREDVGRHNALDKLIGALAHAKVDPAKGAVVVSSRVSVEMVQKTAMLGAPLLIAISAPTKLALDVAEHCGITVAAVVRGDEFEIMSCPERVGMGRGSNVA